MRATAGVRTADARPSGCTATRWQTSAIARRSGGRSAASPEQLFAEYDGHDGDRERLLLAVASCKPFARLLYPGSYIDVSPSLVFADVTYCDTDNRADRFFADRDGVDRLLTNRRGETVVPTARRFLHADYTEQLDFADGGADLLISFYAGFVSAHCTRYLQQGGYLLANDSHGDASLALLDARYELQAVVLPHACGYRVTARDIETYAELHNPDRDVTVESVRHGGRGVRRRRPAAAYLFRRRSARPAHGRGN